MSAIDFIEKMGPEKLEIKKEEFENIYVLHEKLGEARIEEQLMLWRYGAAFVARVEKTKEEQARGILKEVKGLASQNKGLVSQGFEKLTIAQLKKIVETQAAIIQKLNEVS